MDVLETAPTPLLTLVELAFVTIHARTELCPVAIADGVAVKDVIVGSVDATIVALHELVATVEEASVASIVIVCVPAL